MHYYSLITFDYVSHYVSLFFFAFPFRAYEKSQISYDVSLQNPYDNVKITDVNETKKPI